MSTDGRQFTAIDSVKAKGFGSAAYSFVQSNAATGSHFYRLRMQDADGSFVFSPVRNLPVKAASLKLFVNTNPFANNMNFRVNAPQKQEAVITLSDMSGRVVLGKTTMFVQGENSVSLQAATLRNGQYLLSVNTGNSLLKTMVQKIN